MSSDPLRPYSPPRVERVRLRGEDAVLAVCKSTGNIGPVFSGCRKKVSGGGACKALGGS